MAPSPQEHWDTAWHQFHGSPDWRQDWKGLKNLVALDTGHFPERLRPAGCQPHPEPAVAQKPGRLWLGRTALPRICRPALESLGGRCRQ
jgi:hypothetical protein